MSTASKYRAIFACAASFLSRVSQLEIDLAKYRAELQAIFSSPHANRLIAVAGKDRERIIAIRSLLAAGVDPGEITADNLGELALSLECGLIP